MGKSKEERGGGEGRGNGGSITASSIAKKKSKKNKTSKKAKGKTFQVLSSATARVRPAVRFAAHALRMQWCQLTAGWLVFVACGVL